MKNVAAIVALLALPAVAQDLPMATPEEQAWARELAQCLQGDDKERFVARWKDLMLKSVQSVLIDYKVKVYQAQADSDRARNAYISCIKDARKKDEIPREKCAAESAAFDQREADLKALNSYDFTQHNEVVARRLVHAAELLRAEFPRCPSPS